MIPFGFKFSFNRLSIGIDNLVWNHCAENLHPQNPFWHACTQISAKEKGENQRDISIRLQ